MARSMLFVTPLENTVPSCITFSSSLWRYTTALSGSRPSARMSATFLVAIFDVCCHFCPKMEVPRGLDTAHDGVGFVLVHGIEDPPQVALSEIDAATEVWARVLEPREEWGYGLDAEFRLKTGIIFDRARPPGVESLLIHTTFACKGSDITPRHFRPVSTLAKPLQ